MVLAALCEQLLPSHRGLARTHESLAAGNDGLLWQQRHYHSSSNLLRPQQQQQQQETYSNHETNDGPPSNQRATPAGSSRRRNSMIEDSVPNTTASARNLQHPAALLHQPPQSNTHGIIDTSLPPEVSAPATRPKRNTCKASKFLASVASDFDVITDWLFYAHCCKENREYYQEQGTYLIPPWMVGLVLASCLVGTLLWLVLATDGAIAAPFLKVLGYDKLSLGHVLFGCVLLEDIPQVVLTFWIEDYFEDDREFNNYAVLNVVASLYDTLIKLAEAFDQRADVVETGHWCKESLKGHDQAVTCLVPIPQDGEEASESSDEEEEGGLLVDTDGDVFFNAKDPAAAATEPMGRGMRKSLSRPSFRRGNSDRLSVDGNFQQQQIQQNQQQNQRHSLRQDSTKWSKRSLLQEAQDIVADTKLPRMRFLSASKDGTVRLWDIATAGSRNGIYNAARPGHQPSRIFSGHERRVSCLAFVGKPGRKSVPGPAGQPIQSTPPLPVTPGVPDDGKDHHYFLTGSFDGTCKLWNTRFTVYLQYYKIPVSGNESFSETKVTSIAYVRIRRKGGVGELMSGSVSAASSTDFFVSGYKSGKVRLWDMWSGHCLRVFEEPKKSSLWNWRDFKICSVCSMEDSRHFAAGSVDGTIRMWNLGINNNSLAVGSYVQTEHATNSEAVAKTPATVFSGHLGAVLSIECVSPGLVLLSGSADKTARLWSALTGNCLRIFSGHAGPIQDVAVVDQVTVLTASGDRTVRAWDALSAKSFRTYDGHHKSPVTAVALGDQSGCFLTGGEDGTIGLWVFSAIHDKHPASSLYQGTPEAERTLLDILGIEDGALTCGMGCQDVDDGEEAFTEEYRAMT